MPAGELDGSTDDTARLLAQCAAHEPRLRVIARDHQGLVPALNAGLAEARGELIARMDADDIAHPRRLQWQTELMAQRPELTVVGGLVRSFPRAELAGGMVRYERWLNALRTHDEIARDLFVESPLAHPTVMARADSLRAVGGYRAMGWPEDYDLWLRLYGAGARFGKVPRVVLWWREWQGRATRVADEYAGTQFRRCKVHHLKELHLRGRREIVIWGAGKEGRALGKHLKRAALHIVRYIDIAPTKIGKRLLGAPIQSLDALPPSPQPGMPYLLVAVGAQGARQLIRAELSTRCYSEPEHYRTMA